MHHPWTLTTCKLLQTKCILCVYVQMQKLEGWKEVHYEFGITKRIMKMKMSLRNLGDTRLRGRKIQNQKSTVSCSPEEPGGIYLCVNNGDLFPVMRLDVIFQACILKGFFLS